MIGWELLVGAVMGATQAGEPPADPPRTRAEAQRVGRLDIPDEIAPAIFPYLRCKLGSRGIPLRASEDGREEAPTVAVGADCSAVRAEAARRAEDMLESDRGGTRIDRGFFVENALAGIDGFVSGMTMPAPSTEEKHDAQDR